jgi:triosephosphate isomerase (TIM)
MLASTDYISKKEPLVQKMIVGNWKMNGLRGDLTVIGGIVEASTKYPNMRSGLCLPATLISQVVTAYPGFMFGGQDCHMEQSGAHTGCISATMLTDAGANMVIVGHSERRADQCETSDDVRAKAIAAVDAGLLPIICVGETLQQRNSGQALDIVLEQLGASLPGNISPASIVIAYEPIWAIGTGRIPSDDDVAAMHDAIRKKLIQCFGDNGATVAILYGGSMNAENAVTLLSIPNVDGGLIGGASLTAAKFKPIMAAANG